MVGRQQKMQEIEFFLGLVENLADLWVETKNYGLKIGVILDSSTY